jgi:cysteinyl-tRNA synthetase, unknown class
MNTTMNRRGSIHVCAAALAALLGTLTGSGCVPEPAAAPVSVNDPTAGRRSIPSGAGFLAFRGRAGQMGNLAEVAAGYQLIAVDADPANLRFSPQDIETLRSGGRNTVLGILNVGFCDRGQVYWSRAADGYLPCAANQSAQLGERSGRPQHMWMALDDVEHQRFIVEDVAQRIAQTGVDGFLVDGYELLDHDDPEDDAPCDASCVAGGLDLLAALRKTYPKMVIVMDGGLSKRVRKTLVSAYSGRLLDGVVGEEIYTPSFDAQKQADLLAWQALGRKLGGHAFVVVTQDYVGTCADVDWARSIYEASRSHGFTPAIGPSPRKRAAVCRWTF